MNGADAFLTNISLQNASCLFYWNVHIVKEVARVCLTVTWSLTAYCPTWEFIGIVCITVKFNAQYNNFSVQINRLNISLAI